MAIAQEQVLLEHKRKNKDPIYSYSKIAIFDYHDWPQFMLFI